MKIVQNRNQWTRIVDKDKTLTVELQNLLNNNKSENIDCITVELKCRALIYMGWGLSHGQLVKVNEIFIYINRIQITTT